MPSKCHHVALPDGTQAIVRMSHRKCAFCTRASTKQCDFPVLSARGAQIGTCDKHLCDHCAVHVGEDMDHCPEHPRGVLKAPEPAQDPQLALPL